MAAVSILQTFSDEASLEFLVELVRTEKPFVAYQAIKALKFAVGALDSLSYPALADALDRVKGVLDSAAVGSNTDRQLMHQTAVEELRRNSSAA
ncbi:hypothetical protein [Variovorax sp. J22P240]|uniref:hypothetical protein n=1 Tax=Variovorax sp. J22P240 TaxID=3053514 RepID=UPI0033656616